MENDIKNMLPYILKGAYINCSKCDNHDIEEAFPDDAAEIFYEKGWRCEDVVLCPDCSKEKD